MSLHLDFQCLNCHCCHEIKIEAEESGDGVEHEFKCGECGATTKCEVTSIPVLHELELAE